MHTATVQRLLYFVFYDEMRRGRIRQRRINTKDEQEKVRKDREGEMMTR